MGPLAELPLHPLVSTLPILHRLKRFGAEEEPRQEPNQCESGHYYERIGGGPFASPLTRKDPSPSHHSLHHRGHTLFDEPAHLLGVFADRLR